MQRAHAHGDARLPVSCAAWLAGVAPANTLQVFTSGDAWLAAQPMISAAHLPVTTINLGRTLLKVSCEGVWHARRGRPAVSFLAGPLLAASWVPPLGIPLLNPSQQSDRHAPTRPPPNPPCRASRTPLSCWSAALLTVRLGILVAVAVEPSLGSQAPHTLRLRLLLRPTALQMAAGHPCPTYLYGGTRRSCRSHTCLHRSTRRQRSLQHVKMAPATTRH